MKKLALLIRLSYESDGVSMVNDETIERIFDSLLVAGNARWGGLFAV